MHRWVLVIVSLAAIILCLPACLQPIRGDASVFAYVAERMLAGGTPYVDAWDVKSPGIFFQYAAELFIGRSYYAIFFFDLLWAIAAAWVLRAAVTRIAGETAGLFAGICLVLGYVAFMFAGHMLQPETPALFFMAWLLDIAVRPERPTVREGIAAGVALAALFWLKLPFLIFGVVVLPRLFRSGRASVGPICLSLVVFAFVGALVFGYFAMKNAVPELIESAFTIPAKATEVYAVPIAERFSRMGPGFMSVVAPIWTLAILAAAGAMTMAMRWKREILPVALLFAASLFVVFIQGRFLYYHWDILLVAFAAFGGIGAAAISDYASSTIKPVAVRLTIIAVALLLPAFSNLSINWRNLLSSGGDLLTYWKKHPSYYNTVSESVNLADISALQQKLGRDTKPGDTILAFSLDASFNLYSGRPSPTRFFYTWPLIEPRMERQAWRDEFARDVIARRPKVIILTRINFRNGADDLPNLIAWPMLGDWFQQNYELADIIGPLQTYQIRESAATR